MTPEPSPRQVADWQQHGGPPPLPARSAATYTAPEASALWDAARLARRDQVAAATPTGSYFYGDERLWRGLSPQEQSQVKRLRARKRARLYEFRLVADFLRSLRAELGLSQARFARSCKVTTLMVSWWEKQSGHLPSPANWARIATLHSQLLEKLEKENS
jgi:DNA-binding transcriptional regulator YiaG